METGVLKYLKPEKLQQVLNEFCERAHANSQHHVTLFTTSLGRIVATLVWDGFDEMEVTQRQVDVWQFLRTRLSNEELQEVSAIRLRGVKEAAVEESLNESDQSVPWFK